MSFLNLDTKNTQLRNLELAGQVSSIAEQPHAILQSSAKRLLFYALGKLKVGTLTIHCEGTCHVFGSGKKTEPNATIFVQSHAMWAQVLLRGTIGAAETYIKGYWKTNNLVEVIEIFVRNRSVMNSMDSKLAVLSKPFFKLFHLLRRDTLEGSKKNIAAHYDFGDDFFKLWLDPTQTYSSGMFFNQKSTMLGASLRKVAILCEKLKLNDKDHLLEIGSGWGCLAIYAAANYQCKVTTTTISKNQYEFVKKEVSRLGLEDKVTVLFSDYRELSGQYSKIVSVEMIEAVGHSYFDTYFKKLASLLQPGGLAAIQAITILDQFYDSAEKNVDFIQRYIFPGSTIPSISRLMSSVKTSTDLKLVHFEDFTKDYERTIAEWRTSFWQKEAAIRELGMTDEGLRVWDFYFAYCQGGFAAEAIGVGQLLFKKPNL